MPDTEPYLTRHPGDAWVAEDWNGVQVEIRNDIANQIAAAKEDLVKTGVDRATNADQFAHRSDTQWVAELDQRFALSGHTHEGPAAYRRYLKHFSTEPGLDEALLKHKLGVFPLVDLYELKPVTNGTDNTGAAKLFFFYGHADEEKYGLSVRVGRERVRLGLHVEPLLAQLRVRYSDDSSIGDVVNDMWDALRADPNDELPHGQSPWVDDACNEARTVAELKRNQQWDDLYLAIKPAKVTSLDGSGAPANTLFTAQATHLDYDTLWLKLVGLTEPESAGGGAERPRGTADLMILLRS